MRNLFVTGFDATVGHFHLRVKQTVIFLVDELFTDVREPEEGHMGEGAQRQALAAKIQQKHVQGSGGRRFAAILVVIIIALAGLAALAWFQLQPDEASADARAPRHASESYGFVLTSQLAAGEAESDATSDPADDDLIEVAVFEDFLCETCRIFHEDAGEFLNSQLESGVISIEYHPFAFLVSASTDEYSQRAANAAVCVADHAGVAAYVNMHGLLLENQPEQGGTGLTDEELIEFAAASGAEDSAECITDRTFEPWLAEALEAGLAADVQSTPTIRVNGMNVVRSQDGKESMPGPDELEYAIETVS